MMRNQIKKVIPFIIIALLFSCSDDEGVITDQNQLIGTWLLTRETDSDGEDDTYTSNCQNTWEFTTNTITARWDDDCDGTVDDSDSVSYTLDRNKILYQGTSIDGEEVFVKELSTSKLEIEFFEDEGTEDEYSYILFFDRVQ